MSFRGAAPVRGSALALGARRRKAAAGGKLGSGCGAASASAAGFGRAVRTWAGCPGPDGRRPLPGRGWGERDEEGEAGAGQAGGRASPPGPLPLRGHSGAVTLGLRAVTVGNGGCDVSRA